MPIRVMIADDHAIVRIGLISLLEMEDDLVVVGQAANGEEAVAEAKRLKPDVLVLDMVMPLLDGVAVTGILHKALPATRIVFLTTFGTSDGIAHALRNGASGALLKSSTETELVKAIRAVAAGQEYVSREIQSQLDLDPPVEPLTRFQIEALSYLSRGLSNADIAAAKGVSESAVKKLLATTFEKIGAATRAEAVAIAMRKHLLKI